MPVKHSRIFICADRRFPHGDAGGNRIQYIAKALELAGFKPIIITIGESDNSDICNSQNECCYDGLTYKNAKLNKTPVLSFFELYFNSGRKIRKILDSYNPDDNDSMIIYTSNLFFAKALSDNLPEGMLKKTAFDVVEWFSPECYKIGAKDIRYKFFQRCFKKYYPKTGKVIAISHNLENHFKNIGCRVLYLPIFIDPEKFTEYSAKRTEDKIRLIYSGNPQNKDAIEVMLGAIEKLSSETLKKTEIHITSVSRDTVSSILGDKEYLLNKYSKNIFFHPWMEYAELLEIYKKSDALLLSRRDTLVTRSNFPSKIPELLACGTIVITNNVGDYPAYLDDGGNALFYNECTAESCAGAIEKYAALTAEQREQMRLNAIKCANDKFNYKDYAERLADFFESEE